LSPKDIRYSLCGLSSGKQDRRYVRSKNNTFGMKFTFGGY